MGAGQPRDPRGQILTFLFMQLLWMLPKQEVGQALFWVSPPESGLPSVISLADGLPGTKDFLGAHSRTSGSLKTPAGP